MQCVHFDFVFFPWKISKSAYRSLNDISCTYPCNLHALPLFSPFFPHFSSSEWPFPSPTNFGSMTLFLIYETAHRNYPRILHLRCFSRGSLPLTVFASSTAAYTFPFGYRTVFAVFCFCCFVVARLPYFFVCQFSRNYPRHFFPWFSVGETIHAIFFRLI